jgi:hypothetical protein
MRLMWTPPTPKSAVACRCGFIASPAEYETHLLGCARTSENFAAQRHRIIQKEAAALAKEGGTFAVQEPQLEGMKRADHLFCLATGDLLVDYTVCNEGAKSARHKTHEQLVREKDLKKQKHYAAGLHGTPLKTFYLDALGGWSADAKAVIKALVEDTTTSVQLATRRISKVMMCASGRMLLRARVASRIDVEAQRTLDAWTRKVPATTTTYATAHVSSAATLVEPSDAVVAVVVEEEDDVFEAEDEEVPPVVSLPVDSPLLSVPVAAPNPHLAMNKEEEVNREMEIVEERNVRIMRMMSGSKKKA